MAQSICKERQQLSFPEAAGRELGSEHQRSRCSSAHRRWDRWYPWAAKKGCAHQVVPNGARDATCESPKELSKIEPSTKTQDMQTHCYRDSVPQTSFCFCFAESNETFTGNAIATGLKSCRDHPEESAFWFQKTSCFWQLQRQRKPMVSATPKTTRLLEAKFPGRTLCFNFQRNVEHTPPKFMLHLLQTRRLSQNAVPLPPASRF